MEVHHSTQTLPIATGRKKWIHYLFEFLMLFLAVFCGFLAENKREEMVERTRERQYINSLIRDLKIDTANLTNFIVEYLMTKNKIDTILANFDEFTKHFSLSAGQNLFNIIYYHRDFIYSDRTMQQLKNAGGLRLINPIASDSIIAYDAEIRDMYLQLDYNLDIYLQLIDLSNKMINYRKVISENKTRFLGDNLFTGNANFWIKKDPELFEQLYNHLNLYYFTNHYSVLRMNNLKKRGSDLINFLQTEYHLK